MTPSAPQDLATQWSVARRLYPLYRELAREFVIDVQPCGGLEAGSDAPEAELIEEADHWIADMDQRIQVHQLRQFLQTNSAVEPDIPLYLMQHFLAKTSKTDSDRDKVDFLLVQYFSQLAPSELEDNQVDLTYVAQALEPALGEVDLKPPVWLNSLDRVLDAARHCRSLDELLHGGVLAQGRKAKAQAGDLFFLPIALVAFTRFGYLMRRVFFRLMHGDLNAVLDGLNELHDKGVAKIDCRRAQFSADEPIARLRMICQSWKVMFQAEYSSGQPLRMLVDLRASVEHALGRDHALSAVAPLSPPKTPKLSRPNAATPSPTAPPARNKDASASVARAAAAGATTDKSARVGDQKTASVKSEGKSSLADSASPEFEVSSAPQWDPDSGPQSGGQ
jgi:hypothetical protein